MPVATAALLRQTQRRRSSQHRVPLFISGISVLSIIIAAAFLLLLLISVLAFLAPPLLDDPLFISNHNNREHRTPSLPPLLFVDSLGLLKKNISAFESFVVPSGGASGSRHDLWRSNRSKHYFGCSNSTPKFPTVEAVTRPNRYLMIVTSGGLNQQRTGITDAVVAARILNATLVVPKLDKRSFWKDGRLANKLEIDLQKLRCRVNYHALKFTDPILEMGNKLIERMRKKSKNFIALHLRFEPDMLAFSGCDYGGGEKEGIELGAIRKRWKTLHTKNPEKERRHGKCPLTPEEVGLMLRALDFGSDVHIYVASGEVYGGDETLSSLKALFPNCHSKQTLATKEELAPFSLFSSRMAALDFMVCDGSDVFVTNNNGNMARILAGRRRYFGHKKTIRPNATKLVSLFLNRTGMNWEAFVSKVRKHQRGFMGEPNEVRPGRGGFHENPSTCICENSRIKGMFHSKPNYSNNEVNKEEC